MKQFSENFPEKNINGTHICCALWITVSFSESVKFLISGDNKNLKLLYFLLYSSNALSESCTTAACTIPVTPSKEG